MRFVLVKKMDRRLAEQWKKEFVKRGCDIFISSSLNQVSDQLDDSTLLIVDLRNLEEEDDLFVTLLKEQKVRKLLIISDLYIARFNEKWIIHTGNDIGQAVESIIEMSVQCLYFQNIDAIYQLVSALFKICKTYSRELLRDREELSIIAETVPTILYRGRKDWSAKFFSPRIEEISGYPPEAFESGKIKWKDLILREDYDKAKQAIHDALNSNFTYERLYRIKTSSGDIKWIKDVGRIFLDEKTGELQLYGVALDVTVEKRLMEQIELAKTEWESTFNAIDNLILVLDPDFVVTRVNRAYVERSGMEISEIVGKKCWEINCRRADYADMCPYKQKIKDGITVIKEVYSENLGGHFLVMLVPIKDTGNDPLGYVFVYTDITEIKNIERKLREANNELDAIINAASAVVVFVDDQRNIYRINKVAERVLGVSSNDMVGKSIDEVDILKNSSAILGGINQAIEKGEKSDFRDIKIKLQDNRSIYLDVTVHPLKKAHYDKYHALVVAFDVTERKRMEMSTLHAQKLQSMGILAAGIAHEINTPAQCLSNNLQFIFTGIQELIAIIERYKQLKEEAIHYQDDKMVCPNNQIIESEDQTNFDFLKEEILTALKESMECLEHIAKITNSVRQFSHSKPSGDRKAMDINKLLKDMVTMTRSLWKRIADVNFHLDNSLLPIICIPAEIKQVLLNIFMNAIDAIKEKKDKDPNFKGIIDIKTRHKYPWCEIIIADNGVGIPNEIKDKVFEPFFTTKDPGVGTGQGLAIAQSIVVRKHKGQIFFESEPNKQTTFVIRLPLNSSAENEF